MTDCELLAQLRSASGRSRSSPRPALDSACAPTLAARMRLDSADAAAKRAALVQAQLGALTNRFDELSIGATDTDVALRAVLTQAQATTLAKTLGVFLPSAR